MGSVFAMRSSVDLILVDIRLAHGFCRVVERIRLIGLSRVDGSHATHGLVGAELQRLTVFRAS